jgi:hypothetical protein
MSEYKPIESRVRRVRRYEDKDVVTSFAEIPGPEASYAMRLIEQHAMVAGKHGGEDSQGRARLELQTPGELVARSFAIAELAFTEARRRGWTIECPLPEPELQQEQEPAP